MEKAEIEQHIEEFFAKNQMAFEKLSIRPFISYKLEVDNLRSFLHYIKSDNNLRYTILTDLFGADFPEREKRFEICYSLLSLELNSRILVKIQVGDGQETSSIADIHSSACWYEREVFDMYGVTFSGSPDLRRILTDYGFVGHPLRKDFPLTGHVQVRYDEELGRVINEPVKLVQEFRNFDFESPWLGPNRVLPGDEKAEKENN